MKKLILCASFVTLLGGAAGATEIINHTNLEWTCTVEVDKLTIPSSDDRKIRPAVTCTAGEKGEHTIKCKSRKNDIYITGKSAPYSCAEQK